MTARHLAAVPDQPRRAVLYVRVSALMGRGGDDFHSPDVQVGAMRRSTAGMSEVETVEDIDVSGTTFSRKGLDRIRELVEAGKVDVIAVYDLSRLGRNVLESLQFLRWLNERGVTILSACEQIDTSTPAGEMMLINMLNLAQYRSREIGRAWQQVLARRAERGQHHGRVPAGMRRRDDNRLEPDPTTGPAVRRAFRDYANDHPVRQVRRRLCADLNASITEGGFKRLLANEVYRGVVKVGSVRTEGAHEPLVDEVTWARVQRRIERDRRIPSRTLEARYSITGVAVCGRCGGPAGVIPQWRAAGRRRAGHGVFCRDHRQGRGQCAGCGMLNLASVEDEILRQIQHYVRELRGDIAKEATRLARAARAGVDAGAVERELAETRTAMVRLTTRWARDQRAEDAVYEQSMAELRQAEQDLAERLDQLRESASATPLHEVAELADQLVTMWPELEPHERNRVLRRLARRVVIKPAAYRAQPARDRVLVEWQ